MADLDARRGCVITTHGGGPRPVISGKDVVSSFTEYSAPAYTFTVSIEAMVANRGYPGVFEDRVRLTEVIVGDAGIADAAAAIAYVEANPGTFYFAGPGTHAAGWAAGSKTYYVHASDSGNPGSNGKTYEVYKRLFAVLLGGNRWESVVFDAGFHHDGLPGAYPADLKNCAHVLFPRHGSLSEVASYENHEVIGANPRYISGLYHSNPASGAMAKPTMVKGTVVVGSENLTTRSTAFYTHGSDGSGNAKQGWIIEDADVSYVGMIAGHSETDYVRFRNLRARHFTGITDGQSNELTFLDSDLRGGHPAASSGDRMVQIKEGSTLTFQRCMLDVIHRHLLSQGVGSNAGSLVMKDSTLICRGSALGGNIPAFFRTETASATIDRLELRRSTLYMANDRAGYLAWYGSVGDLVVDDLYLIGLVDTGTAAPARDPNLYVNSVATRLSSILPSARVIWGDPARVIATDDESGFALKAGAYRPGMRIRSAVAFSEDGAQNPRRHILVGDSIEGWLYTASGSTILVESPTAFLRAVAFCNASTRSFVAVGDSGTVYYSDANGENWAEATSGVTDVLRAVTAHTSGVVVAVGDDGTVLRSTDSGATWSEVTSGTSARLRAVATDGTTWIAAGDGGVVGSNGS